MTTNELRNLPWWTPLTVVNPTYFSPISTHIRPGETVYLAHSNDHELREGEAEIMVHTPCYPDKYGTIPASCLTPA